MRQIQEMYEEKEELIIKQNELTKEIEEMEFAKNDYIARKNYYRVYYRLEVMLIFVLVMSIICGVYLAINGDNIEILVIVAAVSVLILGATAIKRKSLYVIDDDTICESMILKLEKTWEVMNPDYLTKKNHLEVISQRIKELDNAIKMSNTLY